MFDKLTWGRRSRQGFAGPRWYGLLELLPWLNEVRSSKWLWSMNSRCKYISLWIDTRDGHCIISDRDKNKISLEELRYQYGSDSQGLPVLKPLDLPITPSLSWNPFEVGTTNWAKVEEAYNASQEDLKRSIKEGSIFVTRETPCVHCGLGVITRFRGSKDEFHEHQNDLTDNLCIELRALRKSSP